MQVKSEKFLAVLRANNQKRAHIILTEPVMQQIRDLHSQGYTKTDICSILDVGLHVMHRCYRELGLRGQDGAQSRLRVPELSPEYTALFRAQQLEPIIRDSFSQGKSAVDVGKLCGLNYSTINHYARLLGIAVQTRSQAAAKRRGTLSLTGPLLEILEGELLGDGCLKKPKTPSTEFIYTTSRGSYLVWLAQLLKTYGLEGHTSGQRINKNSFGKVSFDYYSKRYPELFDLYRRWYPQGKKKVPEDLILTPTVCRHWYIGDGSYSKKKAHYSPSLVIATMGFTYDEVQRLQQLLSTFVPEVRVAKHLNGPMLYFNVRAARDFLAYIGPCPKALREVYGYKWGLPKPPPEQLSLSLLPGWGR